MLRRLGNPLQLASLGRLPTVGTEPRRRMARTHRPHKPESRNPMNDTPTTGQVREAFAAWAFDALTGDDSGVPAAREAFDNWLAEHDDEIRADMQVCTVEAAYCICGRRPGHTGQHRCRDCGSWPTCNPDHGMRPPPDKTWLEPAPPPIQIDHEPEQPGLFAWMWQRITGARR